MPMLTNNLLTRIFVYDTFAKEMFDLFPGQSYNADSTLIALMNEDKESVITVTDSSTIIGAVVDDVGDTTSKNLFYDIAFLNVVNNLPVDLIVHLNNFKINEVENKNKLYLTNGFKVGDVLTFTDTLNNNIAEVKLDSKWNRRIVIG